MLAHAHGRLRGFSLAVVAARHAHWNARRDKMRAREVRASRKAPDALFAVVSVHGARLPGFPGAVCRLSALCCVAHAVALVALYAGRT